ncbi:MAG TPA: aldo/keto reductase [Terriglobales bacterium]|nr:aldo/keto reductase [Terriglobales bacterium]
MEYFQFGGMAVSRICLGTWVWAGIDSSESLQSVHRALDLGVNFIDTAPLYGKGLAEELVGRALAEYGHRDKVFVATKVGIEWTDTASFRNSSAAQIRREIDESLRRLGTDYIDLYQVHWPDPHVAIEETAAELLMILRAGKARFLGVSNYSPQQMDAFRSIAPLAAIQPPYNIFERGAEDDVLPYARNHKLAVLAYGAICRGLLSGKMKASTRLAANDYRQTDPKFQPPRFEQYLAAAQALEKLARERHSKSLLALAVRWLLDRGTVPIWGVRVAAQLDAVNEAFGWKLGLADMRAIDAIVAENVLDPAGPEFMAQPARP